ncbi:MAG: hypothetical protein HRU38_20280 [Saccharospirillaceae bacterium]|nr:hypothetical protein [Saccharospirillaceae bacterium]
MDNITSYSSTSRLWLKTLLLTIVFSLASILTHYTNIYVVQAFSVVFVVLILCDINRLDRVLYVAIVTLLFIEYDVTVYLRLWHPLVAILLGYYFFSRSSKLKINNVEFLIFLYFISISIVWFVFDPIVFKMVNLKQWLFYIGLILILCFLSRKMYFDRLVLVVIIATSISLLGFFQFVANKLFGVSSNFLYPAIPNLEIRPVGLFSETTWLSEFALVLSIVSLFLYLKFKSSYYIFSILVFFVIIVITSTRNTYLAMLVLFLFSILYSMVSMRINATSLKISFLVSCIILIVILNSEALLYSLSSIMDRFTAIDSSSGRMEAFLLSKEKMGDGIYFIFGNGYYWDGSFQAGAGTSIGAKSFNLFLMISHIYGVFGLLLILIFLIKFFIQSFFKYFKTKNISYKFSLYILVVYLSMAMFAPLHQYPAGALILSLVVFLNDDLNT